MPSTTQESSIAAQLRDDILRGQYRCGERLPSERDLAERFGVHRSTVRAAFKRLDQLGLVDIRPGGARVNPLDEARLEIVEHMLALDDPPDAELVDQTLEAMSGFLIHAARLGTERATAPQRAELLALLDSMILSEPTEEQRGELLHALTSQFTEATANPVLKLMRQSLRTRYSDYTVPDLQGRAVPPRSMAPHLKRLRMAVESRNGAEAAEAVYRLTSVIREAILRLLEERSTQRARPRPAASRRPGVGRAAGATR